MGNTISIDEAFGLLGSVLLQRGPGQAPVEEVLRAFMEDLPSSQHYERSGFKKLIRALMHSDEMRNDVLAGFMEVSTYASTLHDDSLDALNASFSNLTKGQGKNSKVHENVSDYFEIIIRMLRERNFVLFNHPDFSNDPDEERRLFSYIGADGSSYDKTITARVDKLYDVLKADVDAQGRAKKNLNKTPIDARDNEFRLFLKLRKTNLQDKFTTYRGIRKLKRALVKKTVDEVFDDLDSTEKKLQALHYLNHRFYHDKFQEGMMKNPTVFLSLPILAPHPYPRADNPESSRYLGLGAVFVFLILDERTVKPELFQAKLKEFGDQLWGLISGYLSGYVFYNGTRTLIKFDKEATKSAIAAVMSRNMSHNIGSHVLVKLSDASNLTIGSYEATAEIALLNQYLKHRMSFIADVSLTQTPISGINYLSNDILKRFDNLLLLKEYISGNDNVRSGSIRLSYCNAVEGLSSDTDVPLQIPGDTIGSQAIYILLENFIRNAVKYSEMPALRVPKPGTIDGSKLLYTLDIRICISEPADEFRNSYYILDVIDNASKENFASRSKVSGNNFCLLERLQGIIDEAIQSNGVLRVGGWGILEMKICAAFLRKHPLHDIDFGPEFQAGQPRLLEVHYFTFKDGKTPVIVDPAEPFGEGDLNLGYRLYLLKPKRIAFPAARFLPASVAARNELALQGIHFLEVDVVPGEAAPSIDYELFVTEASGEERLENRHCETQRVLWLRDPGKRAAIQQALDGGKGEELERLVWQLYCEQMNYAGEILISQDGETLAIEDRKIEELIIFDDHGRHFTQVCELAAANASILRSPVSYYEVFRSQSGTASFIERVKQDRNKSGKIWARSGEVWQSRLQEAANVRLLVLDERIQRAAALDGEGELFAKMRIYVPVKERIDLDDPSVGDEVKREQKKKAMEAWIEEQLKESGVCFILLHLGIIERLHGSEPNHVRHFYDDWTAKWGDKATLIIISGRGQPSTLPENSYFTPYDCVEEYLLRNRSKLNLINLIYCTNKRDSHEK